MMTSSEPTGRGQPHLAAGRPSPSDRSLLQLAPLAFRESAPDAEPLVMRQRILQALAADVAGQADSLGLTCGSALFRKEGLWIGLGTQRPLLPGQLAGFVVEHIKFIHDALASSTLPFPRIPRS